MTKYDKKTVWKPSKLRLNPTVKLEIDKFQ